MQAASGDFRAGNENATAGTGIADKIVCPDQVGSPEANLVIQ